MDLKTMLVNLAVIGTILGLFCLYYWWEDRKQKKVIALPQEDRPPTFVHDLSRFDCQKEMGSSHISDRSETCRNCGAKLK